MLNGKNKLIIKDEKNSNTGIGNKSNVKQFKLIDETLLDDSSSNKVKVSNQLKFIDLFAGIGGIRLGLEAVGFQCVFSNDFDKYCKKTYDLNFGENSMFLMDIHRINAQEIPDFDLLAGGFPCQPFSIAGHQRGFKDKRSNVFFDIIRILKVKKPRILFLENVKNLKSHDKGRTMRIIYSELSKLGYKIKARVLNTMEYGGLPQNRERIYIVGFLDKSAFLKFSFPSKIPLKVKVRDLLEDVVEDKFYYNNKPLYNKLKNYVVRKDRVYQWRRHYVRENKKGVCPTLTANMGTGGHNVPIILDDKGIRKLTPRECANLQGFPRSFKFPDLADSHLYKQIGNSVSIPVITRIAEQILKAIN